jgi:hypothetical protein
MDPTILKMKSFMDDPVPMDIKPTDDKKSIGSKIIHHQGSQNTVLSKGK